MPILTLEEYNLICMYQSGTCAGLVKQLTTMLQYLPPEEKALKSLTERVISKLKALAEEDYARMTAAMFPKFNSKEG